MHIYYSNLFTRAWGDPHPPRYRSDVTMMMVVTVVMANPPHKDLLGCPPHPRHPKLATDIASHWTSLGIFPGCPPSPKDPILLDLPWDVPRLPPSPEDPMLLDVPWDVPTGRSVV